MIRDDDGREAALFGAETSGQTFLYARGRRAAVQRRHHRRARPCRATTPAGPRSWRCCGRTSPGRHVTPVFGCSLFAAGDRARQPRRQRGSHAWPRALTIVDHRATASDAARSAADALLPAAPAGHLPAHRSAVRAPDGAAVDRRHRLRRLGVAAGVDGIAPAGRTSTSGRRSSSAASSACSRRSWPSSSRAPPSTRYTIATAQMLMSALLIHLTGGRIETHFHVFGSLAFLAFYRDWRVLRPGDRRRRRRSPAARHVLAAVGLRRARRQQLALARARRLGAVRGRLPGDVVPARRRASCGRSPTRTATLERAHQDQSAARRRADANWSRACG